MAEKPHYDDLRRRAHSIAVLRRFR